MRNIESKKVTKEQKAFQDAFAAGRTVLRKVHKNFEGVQQWSKVIKSNFDGKASDYKIDDNYDPNVSIH